MVIPIELRKLEQESKHCIRREWASVCAHLRCTFHVEVVCCIRWVCICSTKWNIVYAKSIESKPSIENHFLQLEHAKRDSFFHSFYKWICIVRCTRARTHACAHPLRASQPHNHKSNGFDSLNLCCSLVSCEARHTHSHSHASIECEQAA